MASLLRWARSLVRRDPLLPLRFPTTGFDIIPQDVVIEEQMFDGFRAGLYDPVNIREVDHQHVALKVCTRERGNENEYQNYQRLSNADPRHPGYRYLRRALDQLVLPRPGGDHHCLVLKPMGDSWREFVRYNEPRRFTEDLLKPAIKMLLLSLDCLHTECKLVHTDIKADNILLELTDRRVLDAFARAELKTPTPRKPVNGHPVYLSRRFERPRQFGLPQLSDFGAAVRGGVKRNYDAQPDVYRSPEVMFEIPWSYPVDIWNVGCMIWDLFEGKHMFYGQDPIRKKYMTRAHLADVIGMLGPPPLDLLRRGSRSSEFFADDGTLLFPLPHYYANNRVPGRWIAEVEIPNGNSLEASEERLEGENKVKFLELMRGMLQWRPEDRKTAKQLFEDPWLNNPTQ